MFILRKVNAGLMQTWPVGLSDRQENSKTVNYNIWTDQGNQTFNVPLFYFFYVYILCAIWGFMCLIKMVGKPLEQADTL